MPPFYGGAFQTVVGSSSSPSQNPPTQYSPYMNHQNLMDAHHLSNYLTNQYRASLAGSLGVLTNPNLAAAFGGVGGSEEHTANLRLLVEVAVGLWEEQQQRNFEYRN